MAGDFAVVPPFLDVGSRNNPMDRQMTSENGIWKTRSFPLAYGYYQFGELFMKKMEKNSKLVGQIDPNTGVEDTYGDMLDRSIRCALWLKKQGIQSSDMITVCTTDHLDSVIPLIAAFMVGATINMWWHDLSANVIKNLVELYQPKIIFLEKDNFEFTSKLIKGGKDDTLIVCFQEMNEHLSFRKILSEQSASEVSNFECTKIDSPDQVALILPTSGSTGLPKGVMIGYKSLLKYSVFPPGSDLRDKMSPSFDALMYPWISKVESHLNCIAAGITIIIYKQPPTKGVPYYLHEVINKYKVRRVSVSVATAMILSGDLELMKHKMPSIKYAITGGTFMPDKEFAQFAELFPNAQVLCSYGMTEVVGKIAFSQHPRKPGSCGKFYTNVEYKILDKDGSVVLEPKKSGELCLKTYRFCIGYFKNPEATAEALDSEGWYHTGDIACFDEDGEIYIIDRIRDLIRSSIVAVSAAVLDAVIREHPGVSEVAVVGKYKGGRELAIAFVVKRTGVDIQKEDIINMVSQTSSLLFLNYVIFVNTLPRTWTSKIQKNTLRKIIENMPLTAIASTDDILDLSGES